MPTTHRRSTRRPSNHVTPVLTLAVVPYTQWNCRCHTIARKKNANLTGSVEGAIVMLFLSVLLLLCDFVFSNDPPRSGPFSVCPRWPCVSRHALYSSTAGHSARIFLFVSSHLPRISAASATLTGVALLLSSLLSRALFLECFSTCLL